MTIDQGQLIRSDDFNTIRDKFYNIFGSGSSTSGYGQPVGVLTTQQGDIISNNLWISLRNDIVKARQHQTGTLVGTTLANDGNNVYLIEKNDIVTAEIASQYNTFVDTVEQNKFAAHPSQLSPITIVDAQRTKPWNNVITHSITVSASQLGDGSYNNFRYFFNAGGRLEFSVDRAGGSNSAKNFFWSELLNSIGTISFNYSGTTKSGTKGIANPIGFYSLTDTDQVIFSITGSGLYDKDYFKILARIHNTDIIFSVIFADDAAESPIDQNISGVLSSKLVAIKPSGNNVNVLELSAKHSGIDAGVVSTDYIILPTLTVAQEGGSCTIIIVSNDTTPRTLYWTTAGNVNADDFTDGMVSGTINLDDNGQGTLFRDIVADKITEIEDEFYTIDFRIGSFVGPIIASTPTITIEDNSVYEFLVNKVSVSEGETVTYTVNSTPAADGTTLYVTVSGLDNDDVVGGADVARPITIQNSTASGTITIAQDWLVNESEEFVLQLRNSPSGDILAASPKISVIDTSPRFVMSLLVHNSNTLNLTTSGNGVFTVPSNLVKNSISAVIYGGGGGGGGYHHGCSKKTKHPGGNGGSGATGQFTISAIPGQKLQYFVGPGGYGGGMSGSGGTGLTSWFASQSYSAGGGAGGGPGSGGGPGGNGASYGGVSGGLGGKNRDSDPIGKAGSNGYIKLSWKETSNHPAITANSVINYSISTERVPNGTVLYITMIGGVVASDIVGGLNMTVTVNNNVATGSYTVANLTNFGTKNISLVARVGSYSGTIVATTDSTAIIGKGSYSYINPGNYTFTVPDGITSVNVSYPTITGLQTSKVSVTPDTKYTVTIGGPGGVSSINGLINVPVFNKLLFQCSTNVDIYDYFTMRVHSATGQSFSSAGGQGTHYANAASKGVYLYESGEGNHGDLTSWIGVHPSTTDIFNYNPVCDVYLSYFSGRYSFFISVQPSKANGYIAQWSPNDGPPASEGGYGYHINLRVAPFIVISW